MVLALSTASADLPIANAPFLRSLRVKSPRLVPEMMLRAVWKDSCLVMM
tara:strand:+ start:5664 stop:5810 length:147 start_codon:yes stop_codon:yes gene_type:complete